jgi:hypothetical protein
MNQLQKQRDHANLRGSDVLTEHDAVLILNDLYPTLKAAFNGNMASILAAKQKQFLQVKPITESKKNIRTKLVNTIFDFSCIACTQAGNLGRVDLETALAHPLSYLSKANDDDLIGRATDLKNIMNDNRTVLTKITVGNVTTMTTVIDDFVDIVNAPKEEIKEKKGEGTSQLPGLLDENDEIKTRISRLLKAAFPDISIEWETAIEVGQPTGTRKLSLVIRYTDATTGAFLRGVVTQLQIRDEIIEEESTIKGYSRFYSLEKGNYIITSKLTGYTDDVETNVGVYDDKITKLNIEMEASVVSGSANIYVMDKVTGEGKKGVTISFAGLNVTGETDDNGNSNLKLPEGTHKGKATLLNYKNVNFTITIKGRQELDITLLIEREEGV